MAMLTSRILDKRGKVAWRGLLADKRVHIKLIVEGKVIEAMLERELGPEDGGPLLIYRLKEQTK